MQDTEDAVGLASGTEPVREACGIIQINLIFLQYCDFLSIFCSRTPRSAIEAAGLVGDVAEQDLCATAKAYRDLQLKLKRISPQTANAQARMLHRFLKWARTTHGAYKDADLLLNLELAEDFVSLLRKTLSPYSVKNHAASLVSCLDQLLMDQEFRGELGLSYPSKPKIQEAKALWSSLKNRNEKEARTIQRAKLRSGTYRNVPINLVYHFLCVNSHKCEQITKNWNNHIYDASPQDMGLVQAYCSIILALHGQRLCAALNLTAKAVGEAGRASGLRVVRIAEHKTKKSYGPAAVALRPKHFVVFKGLARYRLDVEGPTARLLQAPRGRAGRVLLAPVENHLAARCPGWAGITFNSLRVTLETHAYLASTNNNDAPKRVSSYLLHTQRVSDLHYSYRSDDRVASQALAVQEVLCQLLIMDLARDGTIPVPSDFRGELLTYISSFKNYVDYPFLTLNSAKFLQLSNRRTAAHGP